MSAYKDRSFTDRSLTMGDGAEAIFEAVTKVGYIRMGLDRPPLQVWKLPERIRQIPDYLTTSALVECKGVGRDQLLKIKHTGVGVLSFWNNVHPVEIFISDSHNRRYCQVPLDAIRETIDRPGGVGLKWFPEGKAYLEIPLAHIHGADWSEWPRSAS